MSTVIVIHGGRARIFDSNNLERLLVFIARLFPEGLFKVGTYIYYAS